MSKEKRPGPGPAFQKDNGMWTYYVYPDGVPREAGDYASEEAAKEWSARALRHWEVNSYTYGSIGAIVS
jgi:hypothetical protein